MNQHNPSSNNNAMPGSHAANTPGSNTGNHLIHVPVVWLDKQDVMQRLHISSRTLQNWRSKGLLPYYKVEGKIWYKEADVERLLTERKAVEGKGEVKRER